MANEIDEGGLEVTPQMIEAGRDVIADMHLGLMGLEAGEEERLLVAVFRAMESVRSKGSDLVGETLEVPLVPSQLVNLAYVFRFELHRWWGWMFFGALVGAGIIYAARLVRA